MHAQQLLHMSPERPLKPLKHSLHAAHRLLPLRVLQQPNLRAHPPSRATPALNRLAISADSIAPVASACLEATLLNVWAERERASGDLNGLAGITGSDLGAL